MWRGAWRGASFPSISPGAGRCSLSLPLTAGAPSLPFFFSDRLRVDPKEHPLLLAEPTVQGDSDRERMVEMAFEGHGPPAVFLSRAAVLASFATGRPTAVVVDMGHEATTGER